MGRVPTGRDAAGYDGRAAPIDREQAARPYRLEYVPIIIGKWYNNTQFYESLDPQLSTLNFCMSLNPQPSAP